MAEIFLLLLWVLVVMWKKNLVMAAASHKYSIMMSASGIRCSSPTNKAESFFLFCKEKVQINDKLNLFLSTSAYIIGFWIRIVVSVIWLHGKYCYRDVFFTRNRNDFKSSHFFFFFHCILAGTNPVREISRLINLEKVMFGTYVFQ